MVHIRAISDVHLHPWTLGSTISGIDTDNFNARLFLQMQDLYEATTAPDGAITVFGGDLFHVRGQVSTEALHLLKGKGWTKFDVGVWGNHDMAKMDSVPPAILKDSVGIGENNIHIFGDTHIYTIGYCKTKQDFANRLKWLKSGDFESHNGPKILVAHQGVVGAKYGNGFVHKSKEDITVDDLCLDFFDLVLLGHFHEHQQIADNAYYIGALTAHDWGDVNAARGYLDIHIDGAGKVDIQQTVAKFSSRFIEYHVGENPDVRPQDFVRLVTSDSGDVLMDKEYLPKCAGVSFKVIEDVDKSAPITTNTFTTPEELIVWWANNKGRDPEVGLSLYKAVKQ